MASFIMFKTTFVDRKYIYTGKQSIENKLQTIQHVMNENGVIYLLKYFFRCNILNN